MAFSLSYLLFPYGFFLLIWLIFSAIALYHMLKYGFKNFITLSAVFIYISVAVGLLLISFLFAADIDWQNSIGLLKQNNLYELPDLR